MPKLFMSNQMFDDLVRMSPSGADSGAIPKINYDITYTSNEKPTTGYTASSDQVSLAAAREDIRKLRAEKFELLQKIEELEAQIIEWQEAIEAYQEIAPEKGDEEVGGRARLIRERQATQAFVEKATEDE